MVNEKGMCVEQLRLQGAFARATLVFTGALNAQLVAVIQGDTDLAVLEANIEKAKAGRKQAKDSLVHRGEA